MSRTDKKRHHKDYRERLARYVAPPRPPFYPHWCEHQPRCHLVPVADRVYVIWLDAHERWRVTFGKHHFLVDLRIFVPLTPLEVLAETAHG